MAMVAPRRHHQRGEGVWREGIVHVLARARARHDGDAARRVAAQVSRVDQPGGFQRQRCGRLYGHHARGPQGCAGAPGIRRRLLPGRIPARRPRRLRRCGVARLPERGIRPQGHGRADIAADRASYASVAAKPDPNIDFRRTGVLDVFFGKYGITLTNDVNDHAQWQQGDIVVFDRVKHIGVISDKRDADGFSYVLHNMNQRRRENDYLAFSRRMGVTATTAGTRLACRNPCCARGRAETPRGAGEIIHSRLISL